MVQYKPWNCGSRIKIEKVAQYKAGDTDIWEYEFKVEVGRMMVLVVKLSYFVVEYDGLAAARLENININTLLAKEGGGDLDQSVDMVNKGVLIIIILGRCTL